MLSPTQEAELRARRGRLDPAEIAREIQSLQDRLTGLARNTTLDLQAAITAPQPDTSRGVKLRPAS